MSARPLGPGERVLVTGGTGFVGRHLVRTLAEAGGADLRLLVRRPTSPDDLPAAARGGRSELVRGDLAEPGGLPELCRGVGTVFHCAALLPGQPGPPPTAEAYRRVNADGTLALAAAAAAAGVRRFVLVSSTAAMGAPTQDRVDETSPCRPVDPYGASKRAAEEGLLELGRRAGLEVSVVRPCVVAGEGQRGGVLLKLFKLCRKGLFPVFGAAGLDAHKPLVDVEDVAKALILAAERGGAGEIYLVTSGVRHSLREMLEIAGGLVGRPKPWHTVPLPLARAASALTTPLARALGREPPLSPERLDMFLADRAIDIGKARRELGYAPHYRDVKSMLTRTYAWYGMTGQL